VDVDEYLKSHSKPGTGNDGPRLSFPSRIRIDNDVSPTATVIEVQAGDRLGLGYRIARTLASCNLNIIFAKLATEKSHAFDVFYVRDASGGKITDPGRLHEIEERLCTDAMGLA
jgi:[protein-PII] uridylyltransferase